VTKPTTTDTPPKDESLETKQAAATETEITILEPEPAKSAEEILSESEALRDRIEQYGSKDILKVVESARQEKSLKPFQAELILMQKFFETSKRRMIILFEGRDASGKGGTIRRVSRYMGITGRWLNRFLVFAHPKNTRSS